jgi:hypothetical protein
LCMPDNSIKRTDSYLDPAYSGLAGTRRRPCLSSRRAIFGGLSGGRTPRAVRPARPSLLANSKPSSPGSFASTGAALSVASHRKVAPSSPRSPPGVAKDGPERRRTRMTSISQAQISAKDSERCHLPQFPAQTVRSVFRQAEAVPSTSKVILARQFSATPLSRRRFDN